MPVSPYAASKLATEAYALSYARSFGLPVLAFRFFNVFGPLQPASHAYAAVVPAFVSCALAGNHSRFTETAPRPAISRCRDRRVGSHRRHPSPGDRS
jgi:nucleoside-diphosphate-sugar epimerase